MAKIRKPAIIEKMSKAVEKSGSDKRSARETISDEKKEMKVLKGLMGKGKGKRGNC